MRHAPHLHALQFDLATPPPRSTSVIVWLDGSPRHSVPVDANLDWLDVRQGDELIVAGKRRTVVAVRVYRGDGAGNATPLVECGRVWMRV